MDGSADREEKERRDDREDVSCPTEECKRGHEELDLPRRRTLHGVRAADRVTPRGHTRFEPDGASTTV